MRPAPLTLTTPVQYIKGVGPVRAQQLRRLGIETAADLLQHLPHDYLDRGRLAPLRTVREGSRATTRGQVVEVGRPRRVARGRSLLTAMLADGQARLRVVWFNAPYLADRLRVGEWLVVSGEVTVYAGRPQMVNPQFEPDEASGELAEGRPVPVYPLTAGLKQTALRKIIHAVLDSLAEQVPDPLAALPAAIADLPGTADALRRVHRPASLQEAELGRQRLAFEEALGLQLAVRLRQARYLRRRARVRLDSYGELSTRYVQGLGFALTHAQRRALSAIGQDLKSDTAMHRLLQGDVGCGKTLVALIAMVWMAEAHGQAAFLAPTEVLAQQHGARHVSDLAGLGIRAATLTSGTPLADRREILRDLARGVISIVFGTHALLQEEVTFHRLGLAVVDEQHRFGVAQRAALSGDGAHLLVMSATPIPRSLALTVYGDLDLSIIDEVPSTRAGVTTRLVDTSGLDDVYAEVASRAAQGEQCYLVYPVVEESDGGDLASARAAFDELSQGPLAHVRLGMLHGRMPAREKIEIGSAFERGELDALVTTTVVEVGLDVHRATLMVIHQAERFGLAQLHQLRGRVGRGAHPGTCVLVAGSSIGEKGARRLRHLLTTNDGFQLAQADLQERGMGELHGFRQHGQIPFRALLPFQDELLMQRARDLAQEILKADPDLSREPHRPLGAWLDQLGRRNPLWSAAG